VFDLSTVSSIHLFAISFDPIHQTIGLAKDAVMQTFSFTFAVQKHLFVPITFFKAELMSTKNLTLQSISSFEAVMKATNRTPASTPLAPQLV
jgi:hypothetical protein